MTTLGAPSATYTPPRGLGLYRALTRVRPTVLGSWLKRLLGVRRQPVAARTGEFFVDPASNFGLTLLSHGEYEPAMADVVAAVLPEGGTFVDLGANEGYFSVLAGRRVGPAGRVVAIEPQRHLRPVIERNLAANAVTNVALVQAAVSDRGGEVDLFIAPDTNTGATGLSRATRYGGATDRVEALTLGALFDREQVQVADLLKIDIEGFEYEAVLGSVALFREHRVRAVALELHPWILARRGLDANAILAVFRDAGYARSLRFESLVLVAPGAERDLGPVAAI